MSTFSFRRLSFLFAVVLAPHFAAAQSAGAPDSLSFQGFLTDTLGNPVDSADVGMLFKLYKDGSMVWSETQIVDVNNGVFNVLLGKVTDLSQLAFDQPIELGIRLGGEISEMTPRTPLAAAAFAKALPGMYTFYHSNAFTKSYNIVGGASNNVVAAGVSGATISGGGGISTGLSKPNQVTFDYGTVGGGSGNTAGGRFGTIGGGSGNTASETWATVGGGSGNTASGFEATVGGGKSNTASSTGATTSGGDDNTATNTYATVGGGFSNDATGDKAFIGGGNSNTSVGTEATVGGGFSNTAGGMRAVVGGGFTNQAGGLASTVGGGSGNTADGFASTIPGGQGNLASGGYSFAAGHKARAIHNGSFVWADSTSPTGSSFSSTADEQFLIRAGGGVGIGTNAPNSQLTVSGNTDILGALSVGVSSPDNQLTVEGNADVTGKLGVGDTSPRAMVTVRGPNHATDGPIMFMYGDAADQVESGRIRFVESTGAGNTRGGYIHYDGSANQLYIGTVDFAGTSENALTIRRENRNVGLGVDPTERLHVNGNALADAHTLTSDARLKKNIVPLENALGILGALRGVRFDWREEMGDLAGEGADIGVIAQEVAEVVPEVVHETTSGYLTVDYAKLVPVLIEAIKAQQADLDQLRATMQRAGIQ